jgi:hypothetical protein
MHCVLETCPPKDARRILQMTSLNIKENNQLSCQRCHNYSLSDSERARARASGSHWASRWKKRSLFLAAQLNRWESQEEEQQESKRKRPRKRKKRRRKRHSPHDDEPASTPSADTVTIGTSSSQRPANILAPYTPCSDKEKLNPSP